jgi:Kef-type K+ transport system membrane component KefB
VFGPLLDVVVALAAIVVVARAAGLALRRVGQPSVLGQIAAGVILGPSVLGAISGGLETDLLGPDTRSAVSTIGQLGLIGFMLVIGLELDAGAVAARRRAVLSIASASVAVPFVLGLALAVPLLERHATVGGSSVELAPFALFIGAALSITAFPVLAAILREHRVQRTELGALVLACAAAGDAIGWALLAATLAVLQASDAAALVAIVAQTLLFLFVVRRFVRPLVLAPIAARQARLGRLRRRDAALLLAVALVAAGTTHAIGLHAVIGAFIVGAAMPRGARGAASEAAARALHPAVMAVAPVAFAVPGLTLDLTGLAVADAVELVVVLVVACVGKLVGVTVAARRQGLNGRDAAAIGILMNTRGLVEVIVLTVGRSAGLLDDRLFAVLLAMALITTAATSPLLRLLWRGSAARAGRDASPSAAGAASAA